MPIEIKELIVRAWIDTQPKEKHDVKQFSKIGSEVSHMDTAVLDQLSKKINDIKDR